MEEKVKEIINALPFHKHLTYKITAGSVVTFYYKSDRYSKPIRLRSFHKNNFDESNKFYIELDEVLGKLKSDYIYVDNKPIVREV